MQESTRAGLERLDKARADDEITISDDIADELRLNATRRSHRAWEQLGATETTPSEQLREARLLMIDAERAAVIDLRNSSGADHEVLQRSLRALDVEQAVLTFTAGRDSAMREEPLNAPEIITNECSHLHALDDDECPPPSGTTCQGCIDEGGDPVHLRICLICGNVACCDSTEGTHATRHFQETGHPVMRSFEVGENWRWCYVDGIIG